MSPSSAETGTSDTTESPERAHPRVRPAAPWIDPPVRRVRCSAVHHVEFTIEPFREGAPGPHVTEAIAAAERLGAAVAVGPFGSACAVAVERSGDVVAAIVAAAFANGADHVNIDISTDDPAAGDGS